MKLHFLVITMIIPLIYGDENATTSVPTTISSPSSSVGPSTSTIPTTIQVSSTTPAITTTKLPKVDNSSSKAAKLPSKRTQFLNTTSYTCSCDLTLNCDVNCCCDIDCSEEIIVAFHCNDEVDIDDYHHGEGLERCEIDSGLFCIIRDNLGSPDYYVKAPSHIEYNAYRWPEISSLSDLEPRHEIAHDFYKYGDILMAYNIKSERHETINIPATLTDSTCYLKDSIKFLNSKTVRCVKSLIDLCATNNELMQQLIHSQLFHRPSKMTDTREAVDVFNINVQVCKHSFVNCTNLSLSEDGVEETELYGEEVFDEIRMEFFINDTTISSATIRFLSHDNLGELVCGVEEFGPTKVIQVIDVRFTNANEKREKRVRKHSRGYIDEDFITNSRLRPLNESAINGDSVLDYFRNDTNPEISFNMKLPKIRQGKCVMDDENYDSIRFNEHSQTLCSVDLVRDDKLNETSCQQIQQQIVQYLFNTMNLTANYTQDNFASDIYVSQFWSPRYDIFSWKQVDVLKPPNWSPESQETEKLLTCSNIPTSIKYSFRSSRVRTSSSRKYENLIEGLTVEFGQNDELKFQIDNENQTTSVEILIQVQFFNMHEKILQNSTESLFSFIKLLIIIFASLSISLA